MARNAKKRRLKERKNRKIMGSGFLDQTVSDIIGDRSRLSKTALQVSLYGAAFVLLAVLIVVSCALYQQYFTKTLSITRGNLVNVDQRMSEGDSDSLEPKQNIQIVSHKENETNIRDREMNFQPSLKKNFTLLRENQTNICTLDEGNNWNFKPLLDEPCIILDEGKTNKLQEDHKEKFKTPFENELFSSSEKEVKIFHDQQKKEAKPALKRTSSSDGEKKVNSFTKFKSEKVHPKTEKAPALVDDRTVNTLYTENKKSFKPTDDETSSFTSKTVKETRRKVAGIKVNKEQNYRHDELLQPYVSNFKNLLAQRRKAMKKYSYPHLLDGVDKRHNLTLEEFHDVYDGKWPVIVTDVVPTWPAFNWSKDFMLNNYGDARVSVLGNINGEKGGYAMDLNYFLPMLSYPTTKTNWAYLEDELFLVQHPELRANILETIYTKDDLFKLFPEEVRPWSSMLLWGTAFSHSTLHIDPYNWTGTNAVFSGLKKWKLFPPGQDEYLSVYPEKSCGFPLECNKYNSPFNTFDPTDEVTKMLRKTKYLEVDQKPGEILFIPTGWFHQAFNPEVTLAVSGQVMNVNNYKIVLEEIFKGGSLRKSVLPKDMNKLSPKKLVEFLMSMLSDDIIDKGAEWTNSILEDMYGDEEDDDEEEDYDDDSLEF